MARASIYGVVIMTLIKVKSRGTDNVTGRKNIVINGAMQIAQRGNQTGLTNAYTGVDRFKFLSNGGSVATGKQGQSSTPENGFPKSLNIDVTTADTSVGAGDYALVRHTMEGHNLQNLKYGTSSAETVTLSFYVKSPKTGVHWVELFTYDGSKFNSASYTVSSANTWEKKTLSFVGETATAIADDNTAGMLVQWWLLAGSNYTGGTHPGNTWHTTTANRVPGQVNVMDSTSNDFYLTGVQLEVSNSASDFEHRSFGEELALCQRYYQVKGAGSGYYAGNGVSTNKIACGFPLATSMRATPSTPPNVNVHRSGNQSVTASIDQISLGYSNDIGSNCQVRFVGHSVSDETPYNVSLNGVLKLDSEL